MLRNDAEGFGWLSMLLHWGMAVLIIGLLAVGLYMADLPREAAGRAELYDLHKSFGILVLILAVVRIAWILISRPPAAPSVLKIWEVYASKAAKLAMYGMMVLLPVSGYMMSTLKGYPVKLFGLALPALVAKNEAAAGTPHEVHEILGTVFLIVLALHVLGALKHRYFDLGEADVLKRMLPGRR